MKDVSEKESSPPSAPFLPRRGAPRKNTVKWNGREIPLVLHDGVWRMRSRSASFPVNFSTGTADLVLARQRCRDFLDANPTPTGRVRGTLEDVAHLYLSAPKVCKSKTARKNVGRLRSVVATAWGKSLADAKLADLPDLWPAFVAARQAVGGKVALPDYSTRRLENRAINSAMRQASSVFIPSLRPYYARHGVTLPQDAGNVTWLALGYSPPAEADDAKLCEAWRLLRDTDTPMWLAVGLARFGALRLADILAARGKWFVQRGEAVYVEVRDWPEDNHYTKTGKPHSALILDASLAEYLMALPRDGHVLTRTDRKHWLETAPQKWLRPFTGSAKAPLHRCRGLYADHLKRETEEAILARQAGIKAASEALGHTTQKTTERHYLTPDK